jgi:hypothetical protein
MYVVGGVVVSIAIGFVADVVVIVMLMSMYNPIVCNTNYNTEMVTTYIHLNN